MDDALLQQQGVTARNRRTAYVRDFSLVIGARATLVPRSNGTAYGIVCRLTHAEIDALYSDASVKVYRPEAVLAHVDDGSVVAALCFNLPLPPSADERNADYAATLRALAERIGLPPVYVSSIT